MAQPAGTKLYLMAPLEIQRRRAVRNAVGRDARGRLRADARRRPDLLASISRRRSTGGGSTDVEVVIDRVTVRPDARIADRRQRGERPGLGPRRARAWPIPATTCRSRDWPVEIHSQHFACERCGRSFEPLSPHNFSFNSPLGWCPACEGLGVQTGTNPAALLRDPKLTLAQGAVALWPAPASRLFARMLESLLARHRHADRRALRAAWRQAPPADHARHRRAVVRRAIPARQTARRKGRAEPAAATRRILPLPIQGSLSGVGRGQPRFARLPRPSWNTWSTKSSARSAAAAGCATTPRPCGSAAARSTNSAACRWASCWPTSAPGSRPPTERKIAGEVLREIRNRLQFLVDVGLDYLTLARPAPTLSGGEMQRIRLAAQVGSGLCGVLYVLDEPTIGLHPRDNRRLLDALKKLRDLGNTLLLVEHDREVIASADQLLDFGPGAGRHGGQIVAQGTPDQVGQRRGSVTGPYLSGKKAIPVPTNRRMASGQGRRGSGEQARRSEAGRAQGRSSRRSLARRPVSAMPRRPGWKSAAHGTTTSRTSTCRSRWARSPWSPAPAAAARARWSKTCSTRRWPARCTAPRPFPAPTTPSAASSRSTR